MARRNIYYNLRLKKDKFESYSIPLEEVLETIGFKWHLSKTSIQKIASMIRYNHNIIQATSPEPKQFLDEDDPIILGFAMILLPLFKAVDESNIDVELCPRVINVGPPVPRRRTQGYQLDLMIRYYDESNVIKFSEILDESYEYSNFVKGEG